MGQDIDILNKCCEQFDIARQNINLGITYNQNNLLVYITKVEETMKKYNVEMSQRIAHIRAHLLTNMNTYNPFEFGALREILEQAKNEIIENEEKDLVLIDETIFIKTPDYIKVIVKEINSCYRHKNYVSCSVLLRRLIETLVIESFEVKGDVLKIQDENGDFYQLKKLITLFLQEKLWNYSKNTRETIVILRELGNLSAHNRKFISRKSDIDKIYTNIRACLDDFIQTIY